MSWRDDERKAIGEAYEPPPPAEYEAYLQEQYARWAVKDVDESETPEEEIARREKRARITQAAVNRYLLGYAEHGTCGDPLRSEPGRLDVTLAYAEEAEADDLAVAEPLRDLHWILKEGDSEACAKAVGAAWRSQHPFRPARSGDTYEMLVPQNDRVKAMHALDQAATLPTPPPLNQLRRVANESFRVLSAPVKRNHCRVNLCDSYVARDVTAQAEAALSRISERARLASRDARNRSVAYRRHLATIALSIADGRVDSNTQLVAGKVTQAIYDATTELTRARADMQELNDELVPRNRDRHEYTRDQHFADLASRIAFCEFILDDAEDVSLIANAVDYLESDRTARELKETS